jgi:hypothetical protein
MPSSELPIAVLGLIFSRNDQDETPVEVKDNVGLTLTNPRSTLREKQISQSNRWKNSRQYHITILRDSDCND